MDRPPASSPRNARRMDRGGAWMSWAPASRVIDRDRAPGVPVARVLALAPNTTVMPTAGTGGPALRFLNMTKKSAKSTGKARQGVSLFLINYRRNSVAFDPHAVQAEISVHPSQIFGWRGVVILIRHRRQRSIWDVTPTDGWRNFLGLSRHDVGRARRRAPAAGTCHLMGRRLRG